MQPWQQTYHRAQQALLVAARGNPRAIIVNLRQVRRKNHVVPLVMLELSQHLAKPSGFELVMVDLSCSLLLPAN
jgi:hypothetical protein